MGGSKHNKRQSQITMRLAMLVAGVCLYGGYSYFTSQSTDNGITSINELNPNYAPDVVQGYGEDHYRRALSHSDKWHNKCKYNWWVDELDKMNNDDMDPSEASRIYVTDELQDDICIGFGNDACKKLTGANIAWLLVVIFLLLYLFVGIAIVCDELFVPALEIVAEDLNLSNDVAGATLMAAGGSAPELATSFVGTFKRSDVGFGTIVGSAVFNVLFVIGMCVMYTPEKYAPLQLTWWPLFRDCTYYVLTLITLAIFMYDGIIELWEAIVQFLMYFGYVAMMSQSEKLEKKATIFYDTYLKKGSVTPTKVDESEKVLDDTIEMGKMEPPTIIAAGDSEDSGSNFLRPSTFRVGILQLLTSKTSITETAGIAFVSKIKGDVNVVFDRIDSNHNGEIDKDELKRCLLELGTPEEELTQEKVDECMSEIDKNNNGYATKADFTVWYTRNEQRLRNKTREIFDKFDTDKAGTITKADMAEFMNALGHDSDDKESKAAIDDALGKIEKDHLTYEEFTAWYESSMFWEAEKASAEQAADAQESMFQGIISGFGELHEMPLRAQISFIGTLPLSLILCLIPDCRPPGRESWAPATLVGSVLMIAVFAIVMVECAEVLGKTANIPDVIMGLTILAAGTSVPDLLSSVIVAQQGEGDMAVSSSIGSNIFDVAFGLPLPWLTFNIVAMVNDCHCPVVVSGSPLSLFISLVVLFIMVAAIVVTINYYDWKMTHELGYAMFAMYFLYVAFSLTMTAILNADQFKTEDCGEFCLGLFEACPTPAPTAPPV